MLEFDAVVVSDLHLGARNSRTACFLRFLEQIRTKRLIVAGDLFDHPELRGLTRDHVRVIDALRLLTDRTRVDWLRGNHDPPAEWFAGLLGLPAADETWLAVGEGRYLVAHGHRWDRAMELPWLVIAGADAVYHGCQWLDPSHRLARTLKRSSKRFCRVVDSIRIAAVREARLREFDGVILGHSHVAGDVRYRGVHYLNAGCWTEKPAAFVGVRQGQARRYYWDSLVRRSQRRQVATWETGELERNHTLGFSLG